MTLIFGICGILGGLIVASADMLLDMKGIDNVKSGRCGMIDSAWSRMDIRRFPLSILLAAIGTPLLFLGMTALAGQMIQGNPVFGKAFWYVSSVGFLSGGFIHTVICLLPVLYKTLSPAYGKEAAEMAVNAVYDAIKLPFWVFYLVLTLVPSIMILWALFAGYLMLSPWYGLLTFPSLMIIGQVLDKLYHKWFYDLPHIIMPTLSLGLMGLLAVLNTL